MPYIRNKTTGETRWVDDQPQTVPIGPQSGKFPYEGPQAAANLENTRADIRNDAARLGLDRERIGMEQERIRIAQQQAAQQREMDALKMQQAKAEAEAKNPLNPGQAQAIEADALSKLQTIQRIQKNYDGSWLPAIGFGAETMAGIGGTAAADISADAEAIKAGGALTEVLKMTQATGRNPFTPMSNSDVELIARNIGNLKQSQSPENFFANLKNYRNAYTNAYAGAVGQRTLSSAIEDQVAKYQRENPGATPRQIETFRRVETDEARKRYEQNMRSGRYAKAAKAVRGGSGAKFLGWED